MLFSLHWFITKWRGAMLMGWASVSLSSFDFTLLAKGTNCFFLLFISPPQIPYDIISLPLGCGKDPLISAKQQSRMLPHWFQKGYKSCDFSNLPPAFITSQHELIYQLSTQTPAPKFSPMLGMRPILQNSLFSQWDSLGKK